MSKKAVLWKEYEKKLPKEDTKFGAIYNSLTNDVTFSLWSPFAKTILVNLYKDAQQEIPSFVFQMHCNRDTGVWNITCSLENSIDGWFYEYVVETEKGKKKCIDPYSLSMAAYKNDNTCGRSAIINPLDSRAFPDGGWTTDETYPAQLFQNYTDAIIYEVSVRDFTIDENSGVSQKGTYLGLIEKLDYIADLGVTHIQLMPVLNFYNNNETKKDFESTGTTKGNNYNWGYDPHNFFTPEGWFSTNPEDPYCRIRELKTLVKAIHKKGLRVIFDVVYNHMAQASFLDDIVPNYYFRLDKKGVYTSNSGCGNDLATEHVMTRRLIEDSILYLVKEYQIDGFRFDLMGLIDSKTIQESYEKCLEMKKDILFIGEGWRMYNGQKGTVGADQDFVSKTDYLAVFNDEFRDLCKAGGMNEKQEAFLTNGSIDENLLLDNIKGIPNRYIAKEPFNNVQYLVCHDGLTLKDSIIVNAHINEYVEEGKKELLQRQKMANALLLTSQGIVFLQSGQERGYTKELSATAILNDCESIGRYVRNSYNSSDNINAIHWKLDKDEESLVEYTKGLISLRRVSTVFRLNKKEIIEKKISLLKTSKDSPLLAYVIDNDKEHWYCIFNASKNKVIVSPYKDDILSFDKLKVFVDAEYASYKYKSEPIGFSVSSAGIYVDPLTSVIFSISD